MNSVISKISKKETPHCGNEQHKIDKNINFPGTPLTNIINEKISIHCIKNLIKKVDTGHQMHEHASHKSLDKWIYVIHK